MNITRLFSRRPKLSLGVMAAVCPLLWWLGLGLETRQGIDSVLDARGGHREVYERAAEVSAVERTLLVDVECDRIFSREGLSLIWEVTEAFAALDHVAYAKSLTHSLMPVRRGLSFAFEPLVPPSPWEEEQLARLERFCLEHPLIRDVMVSSSGRRALITVEYEREAFEKTAAEQLRAEAGELLGSFARDGVRLRASAVPFAELEIREAVAGDVRLFAAGALLLAILVLRAAFLGWKIAGALLLAHLLYLSVLPGLFLGVGYRPEPFAVAVFPLLGAIQLALLAHIGAAFLRARSASLTGGEAVEKAVGETWKPCVFAVLTTGAGLLALTLSGTESVRQLGLWGAAGVAAGFLFSFGPALSILSVASGGRPREGKARSPLITPRPGRNAQPYRAAARRMTRFSQRRARLLIAGAAGLFALTAPGMFLLKPDVRVENFLPRGSEVEEVVQIADKAYGGLHFAQLDLDSGRKDGVAQRDFLEFLWEVHRRAEKIPGVTAVYSYPQVLTVLNQVWHGGRSEALRMPREDWLLRLFMTGLEAFNLPLLGALVDEDRRRAFLIVRVPSVSSERYLNIVETIRRDALERAPADVTIEAGGMVHEFVAADREVVRAQLSSGPAAAAAVAVLLLVLWRSGRLAAIALLITGGPVVSVLGIAGYSGMGLNAITVMAGAIAIGIAVDDAVHFITCWRDAVQQTGDVDAAIERALFLKGPPVFFTSMILIGAFSLLGFSSFLPVAQLGLLVAAALGLTLPAVLLVLPGILGAGARKQR